MAEKATFHEEKPVRRSADEETNTESNEIGSHSDLDIDEKSLQLKIDLRVLPVLVLVYLMAFIDRVNIGNARLFKLCQDLKMSELQYNIALCVFFVSYIVFEVPANIVMKKVKPHIFMSACMFLFGLLVVVQGLVSNFGGLVTVRFFMGIAEAGVFPGCFYLMSMWYKRLEAQRRFSFFINAATFAGGFGGLLAYAIGHLDRVNGYNAWRWIFLLEGLATCILAIAVFFAVSDFPESAKWLSESERAFVIRRLAEDQGRSEIEEPITLSGALRALKDVKVILAGFMYFGPTMTGYSLAYFIPTILSSYGYTPLDAQLHSIPPWAAAFGFSMILAFLSDRSGRRAPFAFFSFAIALIGVTTLFCLHHNKHAQYAAVCVYAMGVFGTVPIIICWFVMNLEGHRNRAVGTAWQIAFGNIAGMVSTFSFPDKYKPRYALGYSLGIGLLCMSIVATAAYLYICIQENRKRVGGRKLIL